MITRMTSKCTVIVCLELVFHIFIYLRLRQTFISWFCGLNRKMIRRYLFLEPRRQREIRNLILLQVHPFLTSLSVRFDSLMFRPGPGCSKGGKRYVPENLYPMDSKVCFDNTYPLDTDLSVAYCYPLFELLGPIQ